MLKSTTEKLSCVGPKKGARTQKGGLVPLCEGALSLQGARSFEGAPDDIAHGRLHCGECGRDYPILAGVAVVVPDVREYLLAHVKGVLAHVPERDLARDLRDELHAARDELMEIEGEAHIDDDLEGARVNALYLMNHYLRVGDGRKFWGPESGGSPEIDALIRAHWDRGPFARIRDWVQKHGPKGSSVIELGCGVGGLARELSSVSGSYLGVDGSFASVVLARSLNLGLSAPELKLPGDLIAGPLSRPFAANGLPRLEKADFIVGDLSAPPLQAHQADLVIALNAIDMLDEPSDLPRGQSRLLRAGGFALQSAPYVWHERVARKLRGRLSEARGAGADSASIARLLYEREGFRIQHEESHVPWIFFKHWRQVELYSVHWFAAKRG